LCNTTLRINHTNSWEGNSTLYSYNRTQVAVLNSPLGPSPTYNKITPLYFTPSFLMTYVSQTTPLPFVTTPNSVPISLSLALQPYWVERQEIGAMMATLISLLGSTLTLGKDGTAVTAQVYSTEVNLHLTGFSFLCWHQLYFTLLSE
jgi:hypothetical protein